jgi:hypothetical protein
MNKIKINENQLKIKKYYIVNQGRLFINFVLLIVVMRGNRKENANFFSKL